jgi:hypothetical protein
VRIRALGASLDAPRVISPGQRWYTILQVDPVDAAGAASSDAMDVDGGGGGGGGVAGALVATLRFGEASSSSQGGAASPPIVQLHRAAGPSRGLGYSSSRVSGGGGVLDGLDLVLEWEEVRPAGAMDAGATGQPPLTGAHHLRNIAAPDGASSSSSTSPHHHHEPTSQRGVAKAAERARAAAAAAGLHDVRWTLEGPSDATLLPAAEGKENNGGDGGSHRSEASSSSSVAIPVTLRAHNPSPSPVRLTFESLSASGGGGGQVMSGGGGGGGGWAAIPGGAGWGDATTAAAAAPPTSGAGGTFAAVTAAATPKTPPPLAPRCLPAGRAWMWAGPVKRTVGDCTSLECSSPTACKPPDSNPSD